MSLYDELLSKPVGPSIPRQRDPLGKLTSPVQRELEIGRDTMQVTITDTMGTINEGTARTYLEEEGQNPDEWEVTHFRKLKYGNPQSPYESVKFSYRRRGVAAAELVDTELTRIITEAPAFDPSALVSTDDGESYTYIVALGDMQFGKADGDGWEGTLQRTIGCLNRAAAMLKVYQLRFNITHVHIAFLGDHIEGFLSQGGANAGRTNLPLTDQIRLTRRTMLHSMLIFAPLCERLTMAAVPGNHGEPVRIAGKGVIRYDDSHDTESLIAVADAAELNPAAFGHVEFFTPDTDELVVVVECSGTIVAHAHGHQWNPNKHFDWWKGQAFNKQSAMFDADLLLAGHLHHKHSEKDGPRKFLGVQSMESESTWWRHRKGTTGDPGLMVLVTANGRTPIEEEVSL